VFAKRSQRTPANEDAADLAAPSPEGPSRGLSRLVQIFNRVQLLFTILPFMRPISEELEDRLITPRLTRRGALGTLATAAALASTTGRLRAQSDLPRSPPARRARNVILMVSDGMSAGTLTIADLYARKTQDRHCHWIRLLADKHSRRGLQTTHSADGPVTDSAAAAAAWGSGFKHTNGAINITPDGRQHVPILVHAAQNGKRTGLVTTTRVTHATPAGFSANVPVRDMEGDIAKQQVDRGIDVLLGGGEKYFPAELLAKAAGATIVRDAAGLSAVDPASPRRLIGLFARHHLPFITDRAGTVPSLPVMASRALDILALGPDGFVLQIEGGRVDHAAHSSDAYALFREQTEFDETIAVVDTFLEGRDDTLLIITTDHGNANPGLTLYGARGRGAFDTLAVPPPSAPPRKSFEWIYDQLADKPAADDKVAALPSLVEQATGVKLGETELRILTSSIKGQRATPFAAANVWTFILGSLLADHYGVGFVSPNHTADMVELLARGPGSEAIPPVVDNTELHAIMVGALGLAPAKPLAGFDQPVPLTRPKTED
jgi:alkaline phosphatase